MGMLAGPALGAAHAEPDPRPQRRPGLEQVREQIARLHDEAESATEAYNAARERTRKQRAAVIRIAKQADTAQARLNRLTDTAGAMARAQYRQGGLPAEARLLLGDDPEGFLRDVSSVRKGQHAARGVISRLSSTKSELDRYAQSAAKEWRKLEANRRKKALAKKRITARIARAERLESRLAKAERERLRELEREAARARQARWLKSEAARKLVGSPAADASPGASAGTAGASPAAARAIAWATRQIGKDYQWGATGPATFDCSGLTMRAWQAAGKRIPRTSQEQWKRLTRVPVAAMRPGDLVIYKKDASHVGLYVGDGGLLHAPRTGRQIVVEGVGSMPILGVVRPDA
ncbi:glycoside hydrolase [Streptomyces sp. SB3404]|uniref:Glycoside hydrolase n=2 Tax=Streptomyces boncukensis TaxID=2711219 RepID=A0A6G4X7G6_9ACTN|nr:C40 family peptidase [Streptomyces boncukensis]NGO73082.1 glycoside hydrolase [Streptomyces boncukensis]